MRDPRTAYVAMGRAGDLIGLLPYFQWLHHHGQKPVVVTSKQYGSVLNHASYVDKDELDLPFEACVKALAYAKQKYRHAVDASVYGWDLVYERKCPHFGMEAWRRAGGDVAERLYRIGNGCKIVLDGFDSAYHRSLVSQHIGNDGRPIILLAFEGNSSPLPEADIWQHMLTTRLSKHAKVINLSGVRLRNVCDLVALYEKASLVITLDSAPLHVCGAVPHIPYIAFQNNGWGTPWYAGHCRGNVIRKVNYTTATQERDDVVNFAEKFILNIHEQRSIRQLKRTVA